jgi:PKD repeat protein
MFIGIFFSCKDNLEEPRLSAEFSADVQQVKAGTAVAFTDLSEGAAARWSWTFEGGKPATSQLSSPSVVYEQPGTYAVTLTLSNGKTSSTLTKQAFITVSYNEIAANFEVDKTTIKQGESLKFKDLSTGLPTTWRWEFIPAAGTPIVSTEQNPTVTFNDAGNYTVKLTASNPAHSHEVTRENLFTVIDVTSVEANFTSDLTGTYAGGSIAFTDQSVGTATAWNWTFEGGSPASSSSQNPTVAYNTPGRYKVKLVASNTAKSSAIEKEGYVVVVPAGDIVAFYPFGGNGNDAGPNKLNPSAIGSVAFTGTDRKAKAGNVAVFDGASGLVVPDHNDFNFETGNYSISFWVKTDKTSRMMIWQESGESGSATSQAWLRIGDNTSTQYMRFNTEDATGGGFANLGSEGKVSDNAWHHVVCVREGQVNRVYIDGVKAKESTIAVLKDVSSEQGFKIGVQKGAATTTNPSGLSNFFNGMLDDMVIYKKALSAAEVSALFNL